MRALPLRCPPRAGLLRTVALLLALLTTSGCIAYRSGPLPKGGGLKAASEPSEMSIAVLVRVTRTVNGEEREMPDRLREGWIRATLDAYRESGLFSEVRRGSSADADVQASVRIEDDVVGSPAFSYLSAMTWLLLPSRSRDQITVMTTYRRREGEILAQLRSKETVTTWFQAFLLPATPFALRDRVVERTIEDLSRATLGRSARKGLLAPPTDSSPDSPADSS